MGFKGPSKKLLAPEVALKEGPYCSAIAGQGSGEGSHSLPRGKINFSYIFHAAWLFFFIIYNLIMLPFTGVIPGNNSKCSRGDSFYFPHFFYSFCSLYP